MNVNRVQVDLLNVSVTPLTVQDIHLVLRRRTEGEPSLLIVGHNLHSSYLVHTDEEFAEIYRRADIVLVDGQPVRWALNLMGRRYDSRHRVGSVDWLRTLDSSVELSKIAVVGSSVEANGLTVSLISTATRAGVKGWHGTSWTLERETEVVEGLKDFGPDLVLIGLGMPLQEKFYLRTQKSLPSATYALVGGAIDQLAGHQARGPAWLGRLGLEWAWRLSKQPRRLSHRYLIEPLKLLKVLAKQALSRRRARRSDNGTDDSSQVKAKPGDKASQ